MKLSNNQIRKIKRRLEHTQASAKRRSKDFNLDFNYIKNILDQKFVLTRENLLIIVLKERNYH